MRARLLSQLTRPAELYQGEDKTISVWTGDDLSAATEIEFTIDTPSQVVKTLSGGAITSVTSTGFTLQIDAADTASVQPGAYKHQARATIAGKKYNLRFNPNAIRIKASVFETAGAVGDYGS